MHSGGCNKKFKDFPRVKDFMREIPPVLPSFTVKEVAKHMEKYKTPVVAVVDKSNRTILGAINIMLLIKPFIPDFIEFIEDFSFVSNLGALEHKIFSGEMHRVFLAADIMEQHYPMIHENNSVVKALFSIYRHNITGLIVCERHHEYKGIISRFDLLRFLYDTDD